MLRYLQVATIKRR